MAQQRTHIRKPLEVEAWIADILGNTWSPVTLLDISLGGAALIASDALASGSTRMLRLSLKGNPELVVFTARISHCTKHALSGSYRVGVEFIRREGQAMAVIEQFIKDSSSDSGSDSAP